LGNADIYWSKPTPRQHEKAKNNRNKSFKEIEKTWK